MKMKNRTVLVTEIRAGDQPRNGEGTRPLNPSGIGYPRRRGDRVKRRLLSLCTFRTLRDVRLESGMGTNADVRPRLWIYGFTP